MAEHKEPDDESAIKAIIDRQFQSLDWNEGHDGEWATFAGDFSADASLYPAARPARRQSVEAFVDRMKGLAQTSLRSFSERMLGAQVHVFGNVAVALGACEITENDKQVTRGVEALLLIKDEGTWTIVSQAWDVESQENPIPTHLISGRE